MILGQRLPVTEARRIGRTAAASEADSTPMRSDLSIFPETASAAVCRAERTIERTVGPSAAFGRSRQYPPLFDATAKHFWRTQSEGCANAKRRYREANGSPNSIERSLGAILLQMRHGCQD